MRRMMYFMVGLLLGAMAGVAWVLLFTPQSGNELRHMIRQRWQDILEEARLAGASRKADIVAQFPILQPTPPSEE
jgi:gas vesicle protein